MGMSGNRVEGRDKVRKVIGGQNSEDAICGSKHF